MLNTNTHRHGQMIPLFSVLMLLGLAVALVGCDGISSSANEDPEFSVEVQTETLGTGAMKVEEVDQGRQGDIVDGTQEVLQDEQEYAAFWNRLHAHQDSVPDRPEVDFSTQMVIAIVLGQRPTGGYSVEIDEVLTTEGREPVQVQSTENIPGDGCAVQQVLTSPYVLVAIDMQSDDVTFSVSEETFSC